MNRQWHQLRCVVTGIAKHQALIAGTLTVEGILGMTLTLFDRIVDALGNIRALRPDGHADAAGTAVEALLA